MSKHLVRILGESKNKNASITDKVTRQTPFWWRGVSLQIQIALSTNGVFLTAAEVGSITVEVKELNATASTAPSMRKVYGAEQCDDTFDGSTWESDGSQLFTAEFSKEEAALEAGRYRLIISHVDGTGSENTYLSTVIAVIEDYHESLSLNAPPLPPSAYYTQEESDSRFATSQALDATSQALDATVQTLADDFVSSSQIGASNGVAALQGGRVPLLQLPDEVINGTNPGAAPLILIAWGESNTTGVDGVNSDIDEEGVDAINPYVFVQSRGPESVRVGSPANVFGESITSSRGATISRYTAPPSLSLMVARQPLPFPRIVRQASISFVFYLAKLIQEREKRPVIIIPCATGASSFANNAWSQGEVMFEDLVARVNSVLEKFPSAEIFATVGQQGEWDNGNADYTNLLRAFIFSLRGRIAKARHTPVVMGSYRTGFEGADEALTLVTSQLPRCVRVDLSSLNSSSAMYRSNSHWSILAHRTELPGRYLAGIDAALADNGDGTYIDNEEGGEADHLLLTRYGSFLELYAPLDEDLLDHSPHKHTLTVLGSVTAESPAARFVRSGEQSGEMGIDPPALAISESYTKAFWVAPSTTSVVNQHLLSSPVPGLSSYLFLDTSFALRSDRDPIGGAEGGPEATKGGKFTHVAFTYSEGVAKWYINGRFVRELTGVARLATTDERRIRIGNSAGMTRPLDGRLGGVVVLSKAATIEEVVDLMNLTLPSF